MKKLLIIGHVWPEPNSTAAGSRMLQLIALFKEAHYQITFATACSKSDRAFDLSKLDVTSEVIELNHSSFDEFIKALCPDIVLFDRFMTEEQFGWRVAEQCPEALRVLDTEDLHSLRKGRGQALKEGKPFDASYLFNDTAKREIASIYRCDMSLIISEAEMRILQKNFKVSSKQLYYLPFLLEKIPESEIRAIKGFDERQHFTTIGNFMHAPNFDSVVYLKTKIWPHIKRTLPKAEVHIYGSYVSPKVEELHNEKEGFLIRGYAEDVNQIMQHARICLAPLRFGAGLKGKLIDAMKNGTPCAMSTIAAEGLFGDSEPNGFVEDNNHKFAGKACELYTNKVLWNGKHLIGFQTINKRFQKQDFQNRFTATVEGVAKQLGEMRLNNFTGQMLMYHKMQSTKFMSKWIEEKNT